MVKTALGIDENIEAVLCYLFIWVSGIVLYLLEDKNKFIRFHGMQSFLVFLPLNIVYVILWLVPFGWIIGWVVVLLMVVLWLVLMIKAFQNERFKLPLVGDLADRYS